MKEINTDKNLPIEELEKKYLDSNNCPMIFDINERYTDVIKQAKEKLSKADVDFIKAFMPKYGALFGRIDVDNVCIDDVRFKAIKNGDIELFIIFNGVRYRYLYNDVYTLMQISKKFVEECDNPIMKVLVDDIMNNPTKYSVTDGKEFNSTLTICLFNMLVWNVSDESKALDFLKAVDIKKQLERYRYETKWFYEDELVYLYCKEESNPKEKIYVVVSEIQEEPPQHIIATRSKLVAMKMVKEDLKDELTDGYFSNANKGTYVENIGMTSFFFKEINGIHYSHTYIIEMDLV